MKTTETNVNHKSEYFVCTPSAKAQRIYMFAKSIGHFIYEPGYELYRNGFESFLFIFIVKGELIIEGETATSGSLVLLDCFGPHHYSSKKGCECYWVHFDGVLARAYFEEICKENGCTNYLIKKYTENVRPIEISYKLISNNSAIESDINRELLNLLDFMQQTNEAPEKTTDSVISDCRFYLDQNFAQDIHLEELASNAGFSTFHFLRLFKSQTGFTPHDYLQTVRLNNATYLLKTTTQSITDICYTCGYSSPSVFTTAFKNAYGMTPKEYRQTN